MHDRLAELRRLLDDGYVLDDIDSGSDCVNARVRRGGRVVTVRLRRSDAWRLLYATDPLLRR